MLCEFWRNNGARYKKLFPIEPSGNQIKAPNGHTVPRYFFNKAAVGTAKYPADPILGLKILQVDVPIVSWVENNPEPINPNTRKAYITAQLLAVSYNDDFLALAFAFTQEIKELEEKLAQAYANRLSKNTFIFGIIFCVVACLASVGLSYLVYKKIMLSGL
jgi:hypothetical protein